MEKIRLEICCGTTCYMLGADKLLRLETLLPDDFRNRVEVSGVPCLNACVSESICRAPFVRINGEPLCQATVESVFDAIRGILEKENPAAPVGEAANEQ